MFKVTFKSIFTSIAIAGIGTLFVSPVITPRVLEFINPCANDTANEAKIGFVIADRNLHGDFSDSATSTPNFAGFMIYYFTCLAVGSMSVSLIKLLFKCLTYKPRVKTLIETGKLKKAVPPKIIVEKENPYK
jgi:hypothetical protein